MENNTNSEILLAIQAIQIGLTRLEEKIDAFEDKSDVQFNQFENTLVSHQKQLNEHEVGIKLIEQRLGPKLHVVSYIAAVVAVVALGLNIVEQLYNN